MDTSFASQHSSASDLTDTGDSGIKGTLIIVVMRAKNLHNRRAISKQNPFCTVRVSNHSARTEAIVRGGQAPNWDHEVRFKLGIDDTAQVMKLAVFDQTGSSADIIGETRVALQPAFDAPVSEGYDAWHPIHYNRKYVGEVYLEMTYYPRKRSSKRQSVVTLSSTHSADTSVDSLATSDFGNTDRRGSNLDLRALRGSSPAPNLSRAPSRPLPSLPRSESGLGISAAPQASHIAPHKLPSIDPPTNTPGYSLPSIDEPAQYSQNGGHFVYNTAQPPAPALQTAPVASAPPLHLRTLDQLTNEAQFYGTLPPLPPHGPSQAQPSHVSPYAPPPHGSDGTPQQEFRGQDDISRQINDRYGASMFERIRP